MAQDRLAARPVPKARGLKSVLAGLLGLIVTPILVFLVGWLLYGSRSTWNIGQGESFVVFLLGVYAAPFGALFGALTTWLTVPCRGSRGMWRLLFLGLYLVGVVVTVIVGVATYA